MKRLLAWLRGQVHTQPETPVLSTPDVGPSANHLALREVHRPSHQFRILGAHLAERVAVARDEHRAEPLTAQGDVEPLAVRPYLRQRPFARGKHLAERPSAPTGHREAGLAVSSDERSGRLVGPGSSVEESHVAIVPARACQDQDPAPDCAAEALAYVADGDRLTLERHYWPGDADESMRSRVLLSPEGEVTWL